MSLNENAICKVQMCNAKYMLVRRPERKKMFVRSKHRMEDNIKVTMCIGTSDLVL